MTFTFHPIMRRGAAGEGGAEDTEDGSATTKTVLNPYPGHDRNGMYPATLIRLDGRDVGSYWPDLKADPIERYGWSLCNNTCGRARDEIAAIAIVQHAWIDPTGYRSQPTLRKTKP
jgi:hypothetical protein